MEIGGIRKVVPNIFANRGVRVPGKDQQDKNGDIVNRKDPQGPADYKILNQVQLLMRLIIDLFTVFEKNTGDQKTT